MHARLNACSLHSPPKAGAKGLGSFGEPPWVHTLLPTPQISAVLRQPSVVPSRGLPRTHSQEPSWRRERSCLLALVLEHSQGPPVEEEEEEASPWLLPRASLLELGVAEAAEPVQQGEAGRLGTGGLPMQKQAVTGPAGRAGAGREGVLRSRPESW